MQEKLPTCARLCAPVPACSRPCRPIAAPAGLCQLLPIPAKCVSPQVTAGPCVRALLSFNNIIFHFQSGRQIPNSKIQAPNKSQIPSGKFQTGKQQKHTTGPRSFRFGLWSFSSCLEMVIWELESVSSDLLFAALLFVWDLSFVICDLLFRGAQREPSTFTGGDAICAARFGALAAARRPNPRPGREKKLLRILGYFGGALADLGAGIRSTGFQVVAQVFNLCGVFGRARS